MKTMHLLAATALLTVAAAPAIAAWDRVGSVNIAFGSDRAVESVRFGGSVEGLNFRAVGSAITCRMIRLTYENGQTENFFAGYLVENIDYNKPVPDVGRNIRNVQFDCGADKRQGGVIEISANVGRFQNDWRNSPDWGSTWSRMFNWGNNQPGNNAPGRGNNNNYNNNVRWEPLDNVRFQDTTVSFNGNRGRNINAVGLMPVEADARCSRVTVQFQNGRDVALTVNNGNVLRRGQTYALDLPGNDRNLRSLRLQCQSEGANGVTMRVLVGR